MQPIYISITILVSDIQPSIQYIMSTAFIIVIFQYHPIYTIHFNTIQIIPFISILFKLYHSFQYYSKYTLHFDTIQIIPFISIPFKLYHSFQYHSKLICIFRLPGIVSEQYITLRRLFDCYKCHSNHMCDKKEWYCKYHSDILFEDCVLKSV